MTNRITKSLILLLVTGLIVSCGGSNSPASVTEPPPTPPSNDAPVISISVSDSSPNEGQKTTLDASGSSDSNNDTLTFSWLQKTGPNLILSSNNSPILEVTPPELTQNETAIIELQLTDGQITVTEEVSLTLENVDLTPKYEINGRNFNLRTQDSYKYTGALTKFINQSRNLLAMFDDGNVESLKFDSDITVAEDDEPFEGEVNVLDPINASILGGFFSEDFRSRPVLVDFDSETVFFTNSNPEASPEFRNYQLDAEKPCIAMPVFRFLIVGQKENGIRIFDQVYEEKSPPNYTYVEDIETDATTCVFKGYNRGAMTYDERSGEVILLKLVDASGNVVESWRNDDAVKSLAAVDKVIPNLNIADGVTLEFVKAIPYSSNTIADSGLALLYSDGKIDGNHRLVLARETSDTNGNPKIEYLVREWAYGVPHDALSTTIDGIDPNASELIITTKDSPYGVVFMSRNSGLWGQANYIEIGLGATDIAPYYSGSTGNGFWVNYPVENTVKLLDVGVTQ